VVLNRQSSNQQQRTNNKTTELRQKEIRLHDWLFVSYVVLLDDVQFTSSFAVYDFVSSKFAIFRFSALIVFSYSAFSNSRFF
jgi:hypothetical protein